MSITFGVKAHSKRNPCKRPPFHSREFAAFEQVRESNFESLKAVDRCDANEMVKAVVFNGVSRDYAIKW